MKNRPFVLCIAGFDPSAGAGILSDIKTCEQLGSYGLGITTATTFQNDSAFYDLNWNSIADISYQLDSVIKEYPITAVKIGLIENLDVLQLIIAKLNQTYEDLPIIWDPILKASAGHLFHESFDTEQLIHVLQHIHLLTPNIPEFEDIKSRLEISTPGAFAKKHCPILLKGGHSETNANDILWTNEMEHELVAERVNGGKHGTGCVLSSAIASFLAHGNELPMACALAKNYTLQFIESNETNLGYHS